MAENTILLKVYLGDKLTSDSNQWLIRVVYVPSEHKKAIFMTIRQDFALKNSSSESPARPKTAPSSGKRSGRGHILVEKCVLTTDGLLMQFAYILNRNKPSVARRHIFTEIRW